MMRWTFVLAAAASLLSAGQARSQTPEIQKQLKQHLKELKNIEKAKADQPGLAQLLEQALKSNPDIDAAQAKVRDAEAELNRVRFKTMNKIVTLQLDLRALQAVKDEAEASYQLALQLFQRGTIPEQALSDKRLTVQKAKADLARAEADLSYLIGKSPPEAPPQYTAGLVLDVSKRPPHEKIPTGSVSSLQPALVKAVRMVLDTEIKADLGEVTLTSLVEWLTDQQVPPLPLNVSLRVGPKSKDVIHRLNFKSAISMGAVFQWIEDQYGVTCIVRDYGIVITDTPPPGAVLLLELWRQQAADEKGRRP